MPCEPQCAVVTGPDTVGGVDVPLHATNESVAGAEVPAAWQRRCGEECESLSWGACIGKTVVAVDVGISIMPVNPFVIGGAKYRRQLGTANVSVPASDVGGGLTIAVERRWQRSDVARDSDAAKHVADTIVKQAQVDVAAPAQLILPQADFVGGDAFSRQTVCRLKTLLKHHAGARLAKADVGVAFVRREIAATTAERRTCGGIGKALAQCDDTLVQIVDTPLSGRLRAT